MKILVIGATGTIGVEVAKALSAGIVCARARARHGVLLEEPGHDGGI
jgi:uncharacterized protein YbjT (DUF2867 family)